MVDALLELASTLAQGASSAGRPKAVELRRSISAAYYALFHSLCYLCATELVGSTKSWRVFTPIYRSIDHAKSRKALESFRTKDKNSTIAEISLAFAQLQDARHEADYSPEPLKYNRTGTLDLISTGRRAVELLRSLPPDEKLELAVRLIALAKRGT